MSWRAAFYAALVLASFAVSTALVLTVQKSGSPSVPAWADAVRPGALSPAHAFLSQQCESCHAPYRGIEASSCVLCHAGDQVLLARQSTAFHATVQLCSACHIEHQGSVRPVRMEHNALLAAARKATTQPPSAGSGTAERALDCFACHSNRSPHGELFGRQCADCHATESWKIAGYRHPSAASTDCAQCHQAPPSHYMGHFHMVSKMVAGQEHARVEQCHLCHQTDAWNAIRGVGWYKHH